MGALSRSKYENLICMTFQHPGFVLTPENMTHGYHADSLGTPFDEASLPGNFFVWAATQKAKFLHGRFLWTN